MAHAKSNLPSSFSTSDGRHSPIGVVLFVITLGVIVYQLKFYGTMITNAKNNSDLESRVSRLERTSLEEKI
tara:strand:- start:6426 stop:6638 length:213 start_codon:yes stop_codon:yes gene_type:complete